MIEYTSEELKNLWDDIVYRNGLDYEDPDLSKFKLAIKGFLMIRGSFYRISENLLYQIVGGNDSKFLDPKHNLSTEFKEVIILAQYIKLNRVPLFITDFPDVANWRLRIGK